MEEDKRASSMVHLTNLSSDFYWFPQKIALTYFILWCKNVKNYQKHQGRGPDLRQDPVEAILVIFGHRALIFLFESSWKEK